MSFEIPYKKISEVLADAADNSMRVSRARQYGDTFTPEFVDSLNAAGRNWWFKPSVMMDMVESATSPGDWDYLGKMVGASAEGFKQYQRQSKARDLFGGGVASGVGHFVGDLGTGVIRTSMSALQFG